MVTIGVDIREWRPRLQTGIGRFLEEFLRIATQLRPRDRFLLVGDVTSEVRVQASNVEIVRAPERFTAWWDQVTLPRILRRSRAEVFYSPYIKVPLVAPCPVVSTIHDLTFFLRTEYNQRLADRCLRPPFWLLCWLVVRRAAAIVVDSATTAADVRRLLGADPARLRTVALATSPQFRPEADPPGDAAVWNRHGVTPGYVLYVGGLLPHKNVPRLVQAHAALPEGVRARHPLLLVGGPPPAGLQPPLEDPAGAGRIRCLGGVPDADLPSLYRGAALFAFPSRYEGFGLPVLEAMACGVPVLCSTAPALVELTAGCAEHVPPEDGPGWQRALSALLGDLSRRQDLGRRGRSRAGAFTRERMTEQILQVLDEVTRCP